MRVVQLIAGVALAGAAMAQSLAPALKTKVDSKLQQLRQWSTDPVIVSAVRNANANPPAEGKGMTDEQWAKLTILDPVVRSFARNPLAQYLKSKKDDQISECFVSTAAGTKVAFLAKTSNWSHAGKDKHKAPMAGKTWIGPAEVDQSTGELEVQVGLPVLDNGKPIGSIVIGLSVSKLQ
jgi:hypothetical protein